MTQQALTLAKTVSEDMIATIRENPDKLYFPFFGEGENILKNGIKLDNVMFTIPGTNFEIYWYGFLIALGILVAMIFGFKRMKTVGIDPDRATDAVIGGVIGAVIGARLYYVIFSLDKYLTADGGLDFKAIINVRDGGLAIYGGLIGAVLVGGIIAKIRKLKLTALLDVIGPCFLIGQAIGRWGNFFNVEAFGSNTTLPWGMMSSRTIQYLADNYDTLALNSGVTVDYNLPVHPCFLYESIWCLIGFIVLSLYLKHRKFDGELFLMYIGWYGLGRFFIEGLRTDSLYFGKIRVSQLVAGTCVLAAVILILVFRGMVRRAGDYVLYCDAEVSKAQLGEYVAYEEMNIRRKELKKKIKEAKAEGESTAELEKELSGLKDKYVERINELKKAAKDKTSQKKSENEEDSYEEEYKNIIEESDEDEDMTSIDGESIDENEHENEYAEKTEDTDENEAGTLDYNASGEDDENV